MYILGIHIGHESSAALMLNGKILGAIQEERFNRIKNSATFPIQSIKFLLDKADIKFDDVNVITIAGEQIGKELPLDVLKRRFKMRGEGILFGIKILLAYFLNSDSIRLKIYDDTNSINLIINKIRELGFTNSKIYFFDHHLCHAASAYYSSPFENSLIFTQDGKGDRASGTVFIGENGRLSELHRQYDYDSVGQFYAEITRYLGFKPNRHEGKITGLAAYGNPGVYIEKFNELIISTFPVIKRSKVLKNKTKWKNNLKLFDIAKIQSNHPEILPYSVSSYKFHEWLNEFTNNKERENLSATIQFAVEEWIVSWCSENMSKHEKKFSDNISLAGGLFANVKVNQKLRDKTKLKNIFIQPAMGDAGLSLGSAQYYWFNQLKNTKKYYFNNAYLGRDYTDEEIESSLLKYKDSFNFKRIENIESKIGQLIYEGFIVGNFQGRSEWGPRALGNRSILIRPIDKNINDIVNKRLSRSEFMPFAPSVLDYRAKDYFINYNPNDKSSEYMTITYDVLPEKVKEINAVVHVDNTARPQVVKEENNERFYNIIKEYEKLSNIGCIVNTSFNLHEEPIVESPDDALRAFKQDAIDVLAINSYLVEKK